jgi:uncharacterized protein YbaR (Trm112 family)
VARQAGAEVREHFHDEEPVVEDGLYCAESQLVYPIVSDIPIMLIEEALPASSSASAPSRASAAADDELADANGRNHSRASVARALREHRRVLGQRSPAVDRRCPGAVERSWVTGVRIWAWRARAARRAAGAAAPRRPAGRLRADRLRLGRVLLRAATSVGRLGELLALLPLLLALATVATESRARVVVRGLIVMGALLAAFGLLQIGRRAPGVELGKRMPGPFSHYRPSPA